MANRQSTLLPSAQALGVQMSSEERQLNNERKRVEAYIRRYNANPDNWNPNMVASLERMALQYQIPFKRQVPKANILQKAGAFLGGVVDAATLDFLIDDDWYSSEATRSAKNWGKGVGTVGSIVGTGGGALAARGALGAGKLASAAAKLGKGAAFTAPGQLSKQAIDKGTKAYQSYKGLASTDDVIKAVKTGSPSQVREILKTGKLDSGQIKTITNAITKEHGAKTAYGKRLTQMVKSNTGDPTGLTPDAIKKLVNSIGNKKAAINTKISSRTGDYTGLFKKIGKDNNLTKEQMKKLAENLSKSNIKTADEMATWLMEKQVSGQLGGLGAISKRAALTAAVAAPLSLAPLGGIEPSRDEKMAAELDPYN